MCNHSPVAHTIWNLACELGMLEEQEEAEKQKSLHDLVVLQTVSTKLKKTFWVKAVYYGN